MLLALDCQLFAVELTARQGSAAESKMSQHLLELCPSSSASARTMLRSALWLAGCCLVVGCASRPASNEPPRPPKPIATLAVLPAVTMNYPSAPLPATGVVTVMSPSGGVSIGGSLVGTAIAAGIQDSRRRGREALADALSEVGFNPAERINEQLDAALNQGPMRVVGISNHFVAADIRAGRGADLLDGAEAILDVTIEESGYYSSMRAGGLSPMLLVKARLHSAQPGFALLEEFEYYADWRENAKDRRWVTTPKEMTFDSVVRLKSEAATARTGLENVVSRFVTLIADDVKRHAAGQLRQD